MIGGHTEVAARRAGRLGDGFFPGKGTPEQIAHLVRVMRQAAEDAGRDPERHRGHRRRPGPGRRRPDRRGASRWPRWASHRLIVPPLAFDAESAAAAYQAFGDAVIAKV